LYIYLSEFEHHLVYERQMSMHTISAYLSDIKQFYAWCGTEGPSFTKEEVSSYSFYLKKLELKYASMHRKLSALQTFFKFLFREGRIALSPKAWIVFPKREKKLPKILSALDIPSLAKNLKTSFPLRDRAILEVLNGCGLRVSECCTIQCENIHFDQSWLDVIGKGGKERRVPLLDSVKLAIEAYLMHERPNLLGRQAMVSELFLNRFGRPLSRQSIFKMVQGLFKGMGKSASPHLFRHTFASKLVNNELDIRYVQRLLGHASVTTTQIYTHVSMDKLRHIYKETHPGMKRKLR